MDGWMDGWIDRGRKDVRGSESWCGVNSPDVACRVWVRWDEDIG